MLAEKELARTGELASLGPIIHNPVEVGRLGELGLQTINQDSVEAGDDSQIGKRTVLIRSHGVSEDLLQRLEDICTGIIDATCPIVKRVQALVKRLCEQGVQVVIVGKIGHPEVKGLAGHCVNGALVVQSARDIDARLDPKRKTALVAQTTISQEIFHEVETALRGRIEELVIHDTTCTSISRRRESIADFAGSQDVVVFVGGRNSSNSRMLFDMCKTVNTRSSWVEDKGEVESAWFRPTDRVGVTGGASTPKGLLHDVAMHIEEIVRHAEQNT
jgi:4-hydroxy-3-methylbut-2-enyl diphosphate reductase